MDFDLYLRANHMIDLNDTDEYGFVKWTPERALEIFQDLYNTSWNAALEEVKKKKYSTVGNGAKNYEVVDVIDIDSLKK